jgi:hypothetical protein
MAIDDAEHERILDMIDDLSSPTDLAGYRAYLRQKYAGEPRLEQIEKVVDRRMRGLLAP